MTETTYDVRVWEVTTTRLKKGTSYRVRWGVAGRERSRSFTTRKLADSFRSDLVAAARRGEAFDTGSGMPVALTPKATGPTWYEHARAFAAMKWPHLAPRSRRSLAEGLTAVTVALLADASNHPGRDVLRATLYRHAFRPDTEPQAGGAEVHQWITRNARPLSDLEDLAVVRSVLDALALRLDGKPAAATVVARHRATFYGALGHAVELGHLDNNPLDRIKWRAPRSFDAIDPAVVINPDQARALLAAVTYVDPAMVAFYALMYYAALRPAEALHVTRNDLRLPRSGWGEAHLRGSTQRAGTLWTETQDAYEDRALKHRASKAVRRVPLTPELVQILRHHLNAYGTGPQGRLFVTRTGTDRHPLPGELSRPVSPASYGTKWRQARALALTPRQRATDLARRPYDLRHACVSTWLAAGVPPSQVAEWAGHGVTVLLRVYAHVLDGQDATALRRIEDALGRVP